MLFDCKSRGFYQFEASSLKKHIESALTYSEWHFPTPRHPKNPFTNIEFTEGQMIKIMKSLYKYEYSSWILESYKASNWNLNLFRFDNLTKLKLESIKELKRNPNTPETNEYLQNFIEEQYDSNEINRKSTLEILNWAVKNKMDHPYMKDWLNLLIEFYNIKTRNNIYYNDDDLLNIIYVKSMRLFDKTDIIAEFGREHLMDIL
jgi:hypothetical protein